VTDSSLAMLTFITVPLAVWPLSRFAGWLKRVSRRGQAAQGHINAVCYEALAGVRVVQAFGAEAHEQERLRRAAQDYWGQLRLSYLIRALRTPTMEILGTMALAALVALLGYRVQHTGADPAHYISFFAAIVMMYDPLKKLGAVSDYLAAGAAAAQRLLEIIQLTPVICDRANAISMGSFKDAIRFENVGFTYGDKPVLCDVNLTLPRGGMVALVGPSGAGKSTLGNLLPRFYDVTSGRILFDTHDLRDIRLKHLRAQVSVVGQETFLFNTTVADNIAYGCPSTTRPAVERAARAAFAEGFINELPQGYDTVIGERGITLSGGQRQRLAIARALLRDAPLLILDEATSHLDVESERFLQAAFDTLMVGRTSLVIAHRLSTVRHADAIAVLKNGRIVEQGKHDALLRQRGEYARLYTMQFAERPAKDRTVATQALG
jgi:subfamily B ATP-binding cassette protein MsbA